MKQFSKSFKLNDLPTPFLLKVFMYFNETDLRQNIIPVCKRWRHICTTQPNLWRKLFVCGVKVPTDFILRRIRCWGSSLEALYLEDIQEPVVVIRQVMRCMSNLEHITIRNCGNIPESALRQLIRKCSKLQTLDLSGTEFEGYLFYEEIAGLSDLKSINLSNNRFLTTRNIMTATLNAPKLEELRISRLAPARLKDEDISFIISNKAHNLRVLALDSANLTNFSFKIILDCGKLERLGLYDAVNLSPEILTKVWKYLPELKVLKVRKAHHISSENILDMFRTGHDVLQKLVSIDFSGCWKINDCGIEAIAVCCNNLQKLKLKGCKSLSNLQPVRDNCLKIEELNVSFCPSLILESIVPIPTLLRKLVIDETTNVDFMKSLKNDKPELCIKMSLSEYNNKMINFK